MTLFNYEDFEDDPPFDAVSEIRWYIEINTDEKGMTGIPKYTAIGATDEIERLRDALRTIADTPAWGYPDKWEDTPTELRHFARAALGEKE